MTVRLTWKGDEVLARIRQAQPPAIAKTVEETAVAARSAHTWRSQTGAADASIVASAPRSAGTRLVGAVAFAIRPVWFLERGWIYHRSGDHAIERAANQKFRDLVYALRDAIKGR